MTDCSRAVEELVLLIRGEGQKRRKANERVPVVVTLLLMHLTETAGMARWLLEVLVKCGEPYTPKHHRHRPCHHQQ